MMNHRTRRVLVGTLFLLPLAACAVSVSFVQKETFPFTSTASTLPETDRLVDLSTVSAVQDHKSNIQSMSLESVDIVVTTVNTPNVATKILSASLALRPDGVAAGDTSQDVLVGRLTNMAISTGSTVHLAGSAALDAFVLSVVKGSGKFHVVFSGSTDGATDLIADADLHVSLEYGVGL